MNNESYLNKDCIDQSENQECSETSHNTSQGITNCHCGGDIIDTNELGGYCIECNLYNAAG